MGLGPPRCFIVSLLVDDVLIMCLSSSGTQKSYDKKSGLDIEDVIPKKQNRKLVDRRYYYSGGSKSQEAGFYRLLCMEDENEGEV